MTIDDASADGGWAVERWMIWGTGLTAILFVIGFALAPVVGMRNRPPLQAFFYWMNVWMLVGLVLLLGYLMLLRLRVKGFLIAHVIREFPKPRLLSLSIGIVLVAANLTAFGFLKTELDYLLPFSADPMLASIDHMFFREDGWRFFAVFRHIGLGTVYHLLWLTWLVTAVVLVLLRPKSRDKDALLIGYFLMWSALGPLIHLMMPAAGPIFYQAMGFGNRFADLQIAPEDAQKLDYLMSGFRTRTFNPGGGISAMPSLHIATMAWTVLAMRRSWLMWPALTISAYMWIASVALGWHYAVDGLVGILIASFAVGLGQVYLGRGSRCKDQSQASASEGNFVLAWGR